MSPETADTAPDAAPGRAPGSAPAGGSASALREALGTITDPSRGPGPDFSTDGGVTVADDHGRTARIQPLGERARISLSDEGRIVGEGEVGVGRLVAALTDAPSAYTVVADLLDEENGPGHRSG